MSYKDVMKNVFLSQKGQTPQTIPLPNQVSNNAGGHYYQESDWNLLDRFLILGSEGGTYYVTPEKLTKENTKVVQRLLLADGIKVVERIVEISTSGRAPKNDSALFALALAASCENQQARQAALANLSKVARTGSHLLQFAEYANHLRGWGRSLRKAVGRWFTDMPLEHLSLQAIKYEQREGWALRDVLRLSHPKCVDDQERCGLFNWIANPQDPQAISTGRSLRLIEGKYLAKEAASPQEIAETVRKYSLPREALPTEALNHVEVWDALLVDMPMTAMIRNLGKMSQIGLLKPFSAASEYVASRLTNREQLARAKITPFQLLLALRTYANGKGALGSLRWKPVQTIVHALDAAFEDSFTLCETTNKRLLIGLDVSGSMRCACTGSPVLSSQEAAAAVASYFVRTEKKVHTIAFDTQDHEFPVTKSERLDDILARMPNGGGTDLSIPITYALNNRLEVDAFIILTDNETWAGKMHTTQALYEYRQHINPQAKLVVMATAANQGTVCDPEDALSFGVAGFDATAPQLVLEFINR